MPKESSIRIAANYEFFLKRLKSSQELRDRVWAGLAKLMIVDVSLTRGQDNPQLVFESLNSTGRELSQADLIRNYVLMSLEPDLQTRLYEQYWRPMEVEFGQEGYVWHFDGFMRHYLTVRTGEIPNVRDVYTAFKSYSQSGKVNGVEAIVTEIRDYARFYCAMALGTETDSDLKLAFHDLRDLRVDVAYPFLLELYADFNSGLLSKPDFLAAVRLVESYVFRRAVCEIQTNSLNKTFATFGRDLKKDRYLESIQAKFLLLPSYRRFPRDDEFRRQLQVRDLYHFRSRSYWLRRMENHERKERVPVDEYTIEHIMPQNEDMRPEWKTMLGEEWECIHGMRLHTLGNLTLTGYNTEYSDRPFHEKRDMKGGFAESPLRMNSGLGSLEVWDENAIVARAERLAEVASKVWDSPKAESLNLNEFQPPKQAEPTQYTLDSYPQLKSEAVKELFDAIRKEILGLDPVVAEVCRFGYVAYKAETNFVDVEPQSKRLKLFLNIPFADLNDSRGIARDVTNIGTWGNGDVEVIFDNLEEIPYIMSLVRQSFERQISAGDQ
jgi:predicted transport protein